MMGHAIPGLLSSVSQKFLHPHLTYLMQFCSKKATFYSHWPDQQGLFLNYPRNKDVLFTKLDVSMKVSGRLGQKSRIGWSTFHRLNWLHFGQNWQDWMMVRCWVVKDKESSFHIYSSWPPVGSILFSNLPFSSPSYEDSCQILLLFLHKGKTVLLKTQDLRTDCQSEDRKESASLLGLTSPDSPAI